VSSGFLSSITIVDESRYIVVEIKKSSLIAGSPDEIESVDIIGWRRGI
jgi:hypothetical protein